MSKRSHFVTHRNGVHVTKNQRKGRWRFTFHFPNLVVFHSDKFGYTRGELKKIASGDRSLDPVWRESFSVSPRQAQIAAEVMEKTLEKALDGHRRAGDAV